MDNTNLREMQMDLESNVLDAQHEIEMGRREAQVSLEENRDQLGAVHKNVQLAMNRVADKAEQRLTALQESLGQLNLLLAVEDRSEPVALGEVAEKVTKLLDSAITELEAIETEDGDAWESGGPELREAWGQFRKHLEKARRYVTKDAMEVAQSLEAGVVERVKRHGENVTPEEMKAGLGSAYEELRPWFRALLMLPEVATPDAKSDD